MQAGRQIPRYIPPVLHGLCALACLTTTIFSIVTARTDWFRAIPTLENIDHAIRLDPLNSYGWTLRADALEQSSQFSGAEQAWARALALNSRDTEAQLRRALLLERRGALQDSERCLLAAADISRTWLPRWALVNFYARHGRHQELFRWSRLALERASDDVTALFPVLEDAGATPDSILAMLPDNRPIVAAWIAFLLRRSTSTQTGLQPAAVRFAELIPQTVPGWPGTVAEAWRQRIYPAQDDERALLLAVADRLLEQAQGRAAMGLWNLLLQRRISAGTKWMVQTPLIDSRFRCRLYYAGPGWRLREGYTQDDFETGELVIRLDGNQPEEIELVRQRTCVPGGNNYSLVEEGRTEELADDSSLAWSLREPATGRTISQVIVHSSGAWTRSGVQLPAAVQDRVLDVVLTCRRSSGSMRAQGTARFRLVALERLPG